MGVEIRAVGGVWGRWRGRTPLRARARRGGGGAGLFGWIGDGGHRDTSFVRLKGACESKPRGARQRHSIAFSTGFVPPCEWPLQIIERPIVGVFQRFGRQSITNPMRNLLAERPLQLCPLQYPSLLYSQIAPPPCPPPTGAVGRISGALAITSSRNYDGVQRHPPPPTLVQLKQTELDDEEADELDRFSLCVEHSGGD